jgi:1-pyrroline-5-carboxylate dehydrogenase
MNAVPFKNEPLTDFSKPENKKAFEQAIEKIKSKIGSEIPLIIGGEKITTKDKIKSVNPAKTSEVIAYVSKAGKAEADKAMNAAL